MREGGTKKRRKGRKKGEKMTTTKKIKIHKWISNLSYTESKLP